MSLGVGSSHSPVSEQVDYFLASISRMITDGSGDFPFWAGVPRTRFYLY